MAAQPLPTALSADALAKEFRDFAYSVSHDLGAPARAVVEFSKLLKNEELEALTEDGKLYLSLIVSNGEKLQHMLSGLLDYSRLNTLAKTLSMVDCKVVLEHCQVVLKEKIKEKRAVLEITPLPHVRADAEQLMQLFLAVLDNALTFHLPDTAPYIQLSVTEEANGWRFSIRDNGIGIEPRFHKQIFDPFQRLHTQEEYPGIGMGLTLAQKIATRHGSRIGVDSMLHHGTTFYFTLPKEDAPNG